VGGGEAAVGSDDAGGAGGDAGGGGDFDAEGTVAGSVSWGGWRSEGSGTEDWMRGWRGRLRAEEMGSRGIGLGALGCRVLPWLPYFPEPIRMAFPCPMWCGETFPVSIPPDSGEVGGGADEEAVFVDGWGGLDGEVEGVFCKDFEFGGGAEDGGGAVFCGDEDAVLVEDGGSGEGAIDAFAPSGVGAFRCC
jgi:hypothetical protein